MSSLEQDLREQGARWATRAMRVWTPSCGLWRTARRDDRGCGGMGLTYVYTGIGASPCGRRVRVVVTPVDADDMPTVYASVAWTVYASASRGGAVLGRGERVLRLDVPDERPVVAHRVIAGILDSAVPIVGQLL